MKSTRRRRDRATHPTIPEHPQEHPAVTDLVPIAASVVDTAKDAVAALARLGERVVKWRTPATAAARVEMSQRAVAFADTAKRARGTAARFDAHGLTYERALETLGLLDEQLTAAARDMGPLLELSAANLPSALDLNDELAQWTAVADDGQDVATSAAAELRAGAAYVDSIVGRLRDQVERLPRNDELVPRVERCNAQLHAAMASLEDLLTALRARA